MHTWVFFGIITIGYVNAQALLETCPPSENIKPCVCRTIKDRQPFVHCDNLTNIDQLLNALQNGMKGHQFYEITIHQSNLGKLPSDAFRGLEVESVTILNSNLTMLGDGINRPPFLGLENSLKYIEIREAFNTAETSLKSLSLSHLKRLNTLVIDRNVIPVIGNDWFESGPYDLKELYFTDSYTRKLGSRVFASLTELKKISVTGGKFDLVTRDMFPDPALHLESLDLSNNALDTLPTNFFTKMPALEDVYLDNNAILSIDEVIWSPIWHQVRHLDLLGNPLKCDKDIKWIFQYRLPEVIEGTCTQPTAKKGIALRKLNLEDFQ